MIAFLPWLRIFAGILVYIIFALLASFITRKAGGNLKEMAGRTSQVVILIGAVTNLLVLIATLLLLTFWVGLPLSALGLSLTSRDLLVSIVGVAAIVTLALALIQWLHRTGRSQVSPHQPVKDSSGLPGLMVMVLVLFIVALQEEVLYRGYITLNLLDSGPVVIIFVSTMIFAAIHLLTNRANFYQILSWLISGAIFAYAYLISGSIWVPIVIHFATDLNNVLMFNIVGQLSFFTISPAPTDRQRAVVRAAIAILLSAALWVIYGPALKLV